MDAAVGAAAKLSANPPAIEPNKQGPSDQTPAVAASTPKKTPNPWGKFSSAVKPGPKENDPPVAAAKEGPGTPADGLTQGTTEEPAGEPTRQTGSVPEGSQPPSGSDPAQGFSGSSVSKINQYIENRKAGEQLMNAAANAAAAAAASAPPAPPARHGGSIAAPVEAPRTDQAASVSGVIPGVGAKAPAELAGKNGSFVPERILQERAEVTSTELPEIISDIRALIPSLEGEELQLAREALDIAQDRQRTEGPQRAQAPEEGKTLTPAEFFSAKMSGTPIPVRAQVTAAPETSPARAAANGPAKNSKQAYQGGAYGNISPDNLPGEGRGVSEAGGSEEAFALLLPRQQKSLASLLNRLKSQLKPITVAKRTSPSDSRGIASLGGVSGDISPQVAAGIRPLALQRLDNVPTLLANAISTPGFAREWISHAAWLLLLAFFLYRVYSYRAANLIVAEVSPVPTPLPAPVAAVSLSKPKITVREKPAIKIAGKSWLKKDRRLKDVKNLEFEERRSDRMASIAKEKTQVIG